MITNWRGRTLRAHASATTLRTLSPRRLRPGIGATLLALSVLMLHDPSAAAVSCTTQSQMTPAERADLAAAVSRLAGYAAAGNTAALRGATLAGVADQFSGIAATVEGVAPLLVHATVSTENLYLLHAQDLKTTDDEAQFFCSVPGSLLLVTITIPQLPPGNYALAIVHAVGVPKPQQFGMILAVPAGPPGTGAAATSSQTTWQLAGFFARPLTIADHDGVWYWTRARELGKTARWSAYFYYESARFLLAPVDFLASPNLAKLEREEAAVRPDGLPSGDNPAPMLIAGGDQTFSITSLRTDGSLGGLDLVLHYNANSSAVDPVFARAQAIQLMKAMLQQHAELRANFHGLWVYADSPGRQPFAVELPMEQIQ